MTPSKDPAFLDDLFEVIKKHAPKYLKGTLTPEEAYRAAWSYAASALSNRQPHRKNTRGRSPIGKTCTKCGKEITSDGEFHHPDPIGKPKLKEPHHRKCHPGGAFEKR
jgi:hypothetical protein